jgi:uncharacterized membrane protein
MKSKAYFLGLKKEESIYLISIIILYLCFNLFRINYYPIYVDEAFTYLNFSSKGFVSSMTRYPEPNNHVFFSLISNIFYHFPFESIFNLRLPNLIIGGITSITLYIFLRKEFSHKVAVIPHVLFTFSYIFSFYSVFARGYMLIMFFTLISIICLYHLYQRFNSKDLIVFSICSILGFYTIPIYLYVYATFFIFLSFLLYKKHLTFKYFFISNLVIGLCVLLLYAPIIYFNGIDAIINNKFTQKIERTVVLDYITSNGKGVYDKLLGVKSGLVLLLLTISLIFVTIKTPNKLKQQTVLAILLFLYLPFLYMLLHSVIPGTRTWCFILIPFVFGITILINEFYKIIPINKYIIYVGGIMLIIIQGNIFIKSHPKYAHPFDRVGEMIARKVMDNGYQNFYFDNKEVLSEQVFIEFAYHKRHKKIHVNNHCSKKLNLDSFDCVIYKNDVILNQKISTNFIEIYKDYSITIMGKRKRKTQ